MSFKDGDFVEIDYSARRTSDNSLVYTTMESVAKKGEIFSENTRYSPQLVVVGKKSVIKGVDDAVKGMSIGDEKKFEIEPSNAFGDRRDDLVTVMSIADFRSRDIDPVPGMQVNIDGMIVTVKSVNSGRVVVDANHPLAGEKLTYEIKVVKRLEKEEDKLKSVADYYTLKTSGASLSDKVAKVVFDSSVKKDSQFFVDKMAFVEAVFKYFDNVEKVVVDEEYAREKKA